MNTPLLGIYIIIQHNHLQKHSYIITLAGTKIDNSVDSEYHHIDFTLKSDADPTFIDQNEYGITGSQTTGDVHYERPLNNCTQRTKMNKLLNNIRKGRTQFEIHS